MTKGYETTACVYRESAGDVCLAVPYQMSAFSLISKTQRLIHQYLCNREAIVHFKHVYILPCQA